MAEFSGISSKMWLAMLKEGGRWSAAEIAKFSKLDAISAHQNLNSLCRTGALRKFDREASAANRVQFGITAGCAIPRGVTVGEILACSLHQQGEEAGT